MIKKTFDEIVFGGLNAAGAEMIDPVPKAPPVRVGARVHDSTSQMRQLIRAVSEDAARAGAESLEEANDFDMEGEEPFSPYEFDEDANLERALAEQFAARREARERANIAAASRAARLRGERLAEIDTEALTQELDRRKAATMTPKARRRNEPEE